MASNLLSGKVAVLYVRHNDPNSARALSMAQYVSDVFVQDVNLLAANQRPGWLTQVPTCVTLADHKILVGSEAMDFLSALYNARVFAASPQPLPAQPSQPVVSHFTNGTPAPTYPPQTYPSAPAQMKMPSLPPAPRAVSLAAAAAPSLANVPMPMPPGTMGSHLPQYPSHMQAKPQQTYPQQTYPPQQAPPNYPSAMQQSAPQQSHQQMAQAQFQQQMMQARLGNNSRGGDNDEFDRGVDGQFSFEKRVSSSLQPASGSGQFGCSLDAAFQPPEEVNFEEPNVSGKVSQRDIEMYTRMREHTDRKLKGSNLMQLQQ